MLTHPFNPLAEKNGFYQNGLGDSVKAYEGKTFKPPSRATVPTIIAPLRVPTLFKNSGSLVPFNYDRGSTPLTTSGSAGSPQVGLSAPQGIPTSTIPVPISESPNLAQDSGASSFSFKNIFGEIVEGGQDLPGTAGQVTKGITAYQTADQVDKEKLASMGILAGLRKWLAPSPDSPADAGGGTVARPIAKALVPTAAVIITAAGLGIGLVSLLRRR